MYRYRLIGNKEWETWYVQKRHFFFWKTIAARTPLYRATEYLENLIEKEAR